MDPSSNKINPCHIPQLLFVIFQENALTTCQIMCSPWTTAAAKLQTMNLQTKYIAMILIYIFTIIKNNTTMMPFYFTIIKKDIAVIPSLVFTAMNYLVIIVFLISSMNLLFCNCKLHTKLPIVSNKLVHVFTFFLMFSFPAKSHCLHGSWAAAMINVSVMNIGVWHQSLLSSYPLRWEQPQSMRDITCVTSSFIGQDHYHMTCDEGKGHRCFTHIVLKYKFPGFYDNKWYWTNIWEPGSNWQNENKVC